MHIALCVRYTKKGSFFVAFDICTARGALISQDTFGHVVGSAGDASRSRCVHGRDEVLPAALGITVRRGGPGVARVCACPCLLPAALNAAAGRSARAIGASSPGRSSARRGGPAPAAVGGGRLVGGAGTAGGAALQGALLMLGRVLHRRVVVLAGGARAAGWCRMIGRECSSNAQSWGRSCELHCCCCSGRRWRRAGGEGDRDLAILRGARGDRGGCGRLRRRCGRLNASCGRGGQRRRGCGSADGALLRGSLSRRVVKGQQLRLDVCVIIAARGQPGGSSARRQ